MEAAGQALSDSAIVESADRRDHIDQLLGLIQEATSVLKNLLHEAELQSPADFGRPVSAKGEVGPEPGSPEPASLALQGSRNALIFFGEEMDHERRRAPLNWEHVARSQIRECFASVGHVGAGVFLRLLRAPGEMVSQDELADAAGVRSGSRRVIKVYICRLRNALANHGVSPDVIQTGRRSYSLQAEAVPDIMRLLQAR